MEDPFDSLTLLLTDIILPSLKTVQGSQAEQIAANDRLEQAIEDLRTHIDTQFAMVSQQLAGCRIELLATQAALRAAQASVQGPHSKAMIH